jgi:dihydrofolate reductase
MRQLIVSEFVSVDGVMEAPGGEPGYPHSGWTIPFGMVPDQMQFKLDEVMEADALLLGRNTYEGFAAAWPGREDEEGFARKMNQMAKYVFTRKLSHPTWSNTTFLRGELTEEVAALKDGDGGPILVAGSRTLVHGLYENDLVDEYRLMVFPLVLGSGFRVFPHDAPNLTMLVEVDTRRYENGVVLHVYRPDTD